MHFNYTVKFIMSLYARFFLADTVIEEITFGWPRQKSDLAMREQLALKLQYAINSVSEQFKSLCMHQNVPYCFISVMRFLNSSFRLMVFPKS